MAKQASTFMEPHGVPSGGDWALQRTAALFFEGTERVSVEACVLQRLDGNALMLSGTLCGMTPHRSMWASGGAMLTLFRVWRAHRHGMTRCAMPRRCAGYNRYANISHNTFLYTGASAIALWGSSNGTHPHQPPGTGPDGTAGNFPRYTLIEANFIRFLGIHEKQSSCVFQAKSAQSVLVCRSKY